MGSLRRAAALASLLATGCASTLGGEAAGRDAQTADARDATAPNDASVDALQDTTDVPTCPTVGAPLDGGTPGGVYVRDMACEISHCCAVMSDGSLRCLGTNRSGELGAGKPGTRYYQPVVMPGLSGVIQVSVGSSVTCALSSDGLVRCLGGNDDGQVGDGSGVDQHAPALVSALRDVAEIRSGDFTSCARTRQGAVSCWGSGIGPLPQRFVSDGASSLAVGGMTGGCGVFDGRVRCARFAQTVLFNGLTDVVRVAAGTGGHVCALRADGSVRCAGANGHGELGAPPGASSTMTDPGLCGVAQISPGFNHTCAVMVDGTVRCWGGNEFGQLGDGTTEDHFAPTLVAGLSGVVRVTTGMFTTCAMRNDGSVQCWGSPAWLPGDTSGNLLRPTPVVW